MRRRGGDLSRHALLLAGARGVGQVVIVGVQAVVARDVGLEGFGVFASGLAAATVLSGLIDFGAGSYWVREYSAGRLLADEFRVRSAGKLSVGGLVALGLLSSGLFGVLPLKFAAIAAGLLVSSVTSQTFQVMLIASRKNVSLSLLALVERFILLVAFLVLWVAFKFASDVSLVVAYMCGSLALALLSRRSVMELAPVFRAPAWRRTWAGSGFYGLSTCLIALQSTDVLLAGAVSGPAPVGSYGSVSRWAVPISLATQAFASLLNPVVASAADRGDVWRRIRGSLWLPSLSVLAAVVMGTLAQPLVLLVLGTRYGDSVAVLRVVALAAALSSVAQIAFTILQARRQERLVAAGFGVAVFTQLGMVIPLVQRFGGLGLAISAAAGQFVLCFMLGSVLFIALKRGTTSKGKSSAVLRRL